MTDIEKDVAALKEQLKKPQSILMKRAIENEIERLHRKITGKGRDRKAKTADGKMVGIGATVFGYNVPQRWTNDGQVEDRPGSIYEKKIEEINRVGRVRFTGWYQFTEMSRSYYSSRAAAHKAMVAEAALDVKGAVRNVASARQRVEDKKHLLEVAKAFNPNPAPAKTTRKMRAA